MASLRDIRKRIKSVKNTQKITKAMKMVSAAKLRRATERVLTARPYADKIARTCAGLASRSADLGEAPHALLQARPESKKGGVVEILAITSDRGLCGAFNSNVVRRSLRMRFDMRDTHKQIRMSTVGRKASDGLKREKIEHKHHDKMWEPLTYKKAQDIALALAQEYVDGKLDALYLVYNEYINATSQKLVVDQMLPIQPLSGDDAVGVDFEYEPSQPVILDTLLPRHLATRIYRALLESQAAEHAARMSAMENASKNAKEMVDTLTLFYNRARQAAITKELMEIIGGAEALKG